jgi:transposase InsO family protein
MSRSDNVWDNAAMESFFSLLKTGLGADISRYRLRLCRTMRLINA